MTTGDWLITGLGIATALAGMALLAWSLLADRLRTRRARREGTLRRCPRCWYDMSATAGLTCPECGRTARHERRLLRSRRRWKLASVAILILALAGAAGAYPHGKNGVWHRWLPDTAVILLIPYTQHDQWAAEEIGRRLGFRSAAPSVSSPGRLAEWQWSLLRWSAERAWLGHADRAVGGATWWLVVMAGPVPDRAFEGLLDLTTSDARSEREWAFMCLERSRFWLAEDKLARAKAAIDESPAQEGFNEKLRQDAARMLGIQLATRATDPLPARIARWERVPLTPEALIAAIDHKPATELIAMNSRFHFPRSSLSDTDESIPDAIGVDRIDIELDDDDLTDCILLVYNRTWLSRGSNVHYEAFPLVRRGEGWRFLGRMDISNCLEGPPEFVSVADEGGRRWLIVRRDAGSSGDGKYFVKQDAWYRLRSSRLALEQAMLLRGHSENGLRHELHASEPLVTRRRSRTLASYDITDNISLAVPDPASPDAPRLVPVAAERGRFEFPLGVPDTKLGQFLTPGPWNGKEPTWAFLGGPEVLTAYRDRLLAIADRGDAERTAVLELVDWYIDWAGPTEALISLREQVEPTSPDPPG